MWLLLQFMQMSDKNNQYCLVFSNKRFAAFLLFVCGVIFFFYTQIGISNGSRNRTHRDNVTRPKYLIHTSSCEIPYDSPYSDDVMPFVQEEAYSSCSEKPLLSYITKKATSVTLNINQTLLPLYSYFSISCCYSEVIRIAPPEGPDSSIRYSSCVLFKNQTPLTVPVIKVQCWSIFGTVYTNVHAIISPLMLAKTPKKFLNGAPPSVVLLGIDSISKQNLERTMPKSQKFLEETDFINLKGYTKIGDNTFPNLIAVLSGQTTDQIYDFCKPNVTVMDNCDLIWESFQKAGYLTAYIEDEVENNVFQYYRRGFFKQPTDFYWRPYMLAAEELPSRLRAGMHYCTGPENTAERILNLAKDFVVTLPNQPKFGLFWITTFSHDNINLPNSMDERVEAFLRGIHPHLNNTILVFFSDHGFRFGGIRNTHTGYVEERLPFIYIHLPKSFREKHPLSYHNIRINTERLTNPFDLYMTLRDILSLANKEHKSSQACPKCHSLFQEVEENRTCIDAAISQHYCLCNGYFYLDVNKESVLSGANFLLSEINKLVAGFKESTQCAIYYLKRVASAGMKTEFDGVKFVNRYLLMIETIPSARFEGSIECPKEDDDKKMVFTLSGEISRTDRYAPNSQCIHDMELKKYCYCDRVLTPIKSAVCSLINCF